MGLSFRWVSSGPRSYRDLRFLPFLDGFQQARGEDSISAPAPFSSRPKCSSCL